MSANDETALKYNFGEWAKGRGDGLKAPWLYYAVEQFVKPFMLDDEEIRNGITDGSNDGGTDAIYFLVNQRQVVSDITDLAAGSISKVRVIFIQVKETGGFPPTEIEKFLELTDDFFDLQKPANSFGERYNTRVVRAMKTWKDKWIKIANDFPDEVAIDYYFVTGSDVEPDDYALDAGKRVTLRAQSQVSKAVSKFHYIGAKELWDQVQRRPPKSKTLFWAENPMSVDDGSVGLVKLRDYLNFIEDEPGVLAERFFESNVRGYQDDVAVNVEIASSLSSDPKNIDFWLLNNGITIITPKVSPDTSKRLEIQDPQIVNGLQTSREIFDYFNECRDVDDNRVVLVKVIVTKDRELQDRIIKATNSQNKMLPSQLRMTDHIHRKIEELFKNKNLYYDRRKGFHRDQGKPARLIVSPNEVAQAIISIVLQKPNDARARPGDYFKSSSKDDSAYKSVFGEDAYPLEIYHTCVKLLEAVDAYLRTRKVGPGVAKNLKFYVAAAIAQDLARMAEPPPLKIVGMKGLAAVSALQIETAFKRVDRAYRRLIKGDKDGDVIARGTSLSTSLRRSAKRQFSKGKV